MSDQDREAVLESVRRHTGSATFGPSPVRLEYIAAPLTVWPTVNATEFLVAIVPLPYDRRSVIDVGRTLQKVVMDATRLGIGTCWIGPGADHASLKRHLGDRFDAEREQIICTCAVGYRSAYAPVFVRVFGRVINQRRALSELFFADEAMQTPADVESAPLARFGRTFEICQWAPSSYNGQTTRAVVRSAEAGGVRAVDFIAVTASRFYAPVALGIWCANWELGCEALGIGGSFEARTSLDGPLQAPRHDVTWVPAHSLSGGGLRSPSDAVCRARCEVEPPSTPIPASEKGTACRGQRALVPLLVRSQGLAEQLLLVAEGVVRALATDAHGSARIRHRRGVVALVPEHLQSPGSSSA